MINIQGIDYEDDFITYILGCKSFKCRMGTRIHKYHILGIVDGDQVVVKWWSGTRWVYAVFWLFEISLRWPAHIYL